MPRNILRGFYLYLLLIITLETPKTCALISVKIAPLLAKANIYYQKPWHSADQRESVLAYVNELSQKSNIKLIIHGYMGSRTHSSIVPLLNAYLAQDMDNILTADWQEAASLDYHTARNAVAATSFTFGRILEDFLNKLQIPASEMHVIGHSLGAHIAGGIGKYFNGSIGRITGLDPALPLFTAHSEDALHSNAAQFVDVIHTDFPIFGDLTPRGTVDFFPNFGITPQKGCEGVDLLSANSCSHNRAVLLFAESIRIPRSFPSLPCTINGIKLRNVNICISEISHMPRVSSNLTQALNYFLHVIYMGEYVDMNEASGLYYLETHGSPPYGLGEHAKLV